MCCVRSPSFYNTLTANCTTNIWMNTRVNAGRVPLSWKILASGHVPEYLYEQGGLEAMGLSFPELQQRVHVNARAQAADKAAGFPRCIRASVGCCAPVRLAPGSQSQHGSG